MPSNQIIFTQEHVVLLKKGESRAIHLWYSTFSPKLRSFFLSRVRVDHDAEELIQDTFLSCLSSLPLYRGESNFWSWMLGVARHELADYYRKLYAKKVISSFPLGDSLLDAFTQETQDNRESVLAVLRQLPHAVAELLRLKYIDHLSVDQIAVELDLEPHAVQGRLYRARKIFKKLYEEMGNI
jgi:RNA polymerase sigma-70 factor, ECF subfamily